MKNDVYYNTKTIPLAERETFNNTILLLTMVKSQYYYIVGFSRPDSKIEIAFDFETELHDRITETIIIDFAYDEESVLFHSTLCNVDGDTDRDMKLGFDSLEGNFTVLDSCIEYNLKVKKDYIIPTSMEQMNKHILCAKNDIITFVEEYYSTICSD